MQIIHKKQRMTERFIVSLSVFLLSFGLIFGSLLGEETVEKNKKEENELSHVADDAHHRDGDINRINFPSLRADIFSVLKGRYYVSASASISDHGTTLGADYESGNIKRVIDEINGAEAVIELAPGVYKVNTPLSIPSNVLLFFQRGAILSISKGVVVMFNCGLFAKEHQIFS